MWTAVNHFQPGILGWVLGTHSATTFLPLWELVRNWKWGASHFCKYMKKGYNEKASKTVKKDEVKKNDTLRPTASKSTLKRGSRNSLQKYRFNRTFKFWALLIHGMNQLFACSYKTPPPGAYSNWEILNSYPYSATLTFERIEKSLRQKMLKEVGAELGRFFFQQYQELKQDRKTADRKIISRVAEYYRQSGEIFRAKTL